jgi:V-type H+-transporting ATPase subunit H
MSLDPPTYLVSLQSNIRQRPIPWDGAVRAGTLSEEQYAKIRAVDKAKKPEERKSIVQGDIDGYRLLFVGGSGKPSIMESAGKQANVIQYILVLLADLLEGKKEKLHCFKARGGKLRLSPPRVPMAGMPCGSTSSP